MWRTSTWKKMSWYLMSSPEPEDFKHATATLSQLPAKICRSKPMAVVTVLVVLVTCGH